MNYSQQQLNDTLPQIGRVSWIGIRPETAVPMRILDSVTAIEGRGLIGDRYRRKQGKRQVTLIQQEHLNVVASLLSRDSIDPALLRRNIAISGINLLALKNKQFRVGNAILEYSGSCDPCSAMEKVLGLGGFNAMLGHGGITAKIICSGEIALGDAVMVCSGESLKYT